MSDSPTSHVCRPAHEILLGDIVGLGGPRHKETREEFSVN